MTNREEDLHKLQRILDEATTHYENGVEIWNSMGLDSPQFAVEAAQAALEEYQRVADLLEPNKFLTLPSQIQILIAGRREIAFANAASAKTFLCDRWSDDGLKNIIDLTQDENDHTQNAVQHFESLNDDNVDFLPELRRNLLSIKARKASLSARLANRQGKYDEAKELYKLAQEKFQQVMEMYEIETPELISIREKVKDSVDRKPERINELDQRGDANGIRWVAITMRLPPQSPLLPNEDLYRREASNYYACSSLVAHHDALDCLQNGDSIQIADEKLEESIRLIYSAMEIFPDNLEFHEDLFNSWRARGEWFGCPVQETENYYHVQCPLAIMHYVGSWYVSPTLEYEALICTVCRKDILECPHFPGQSVDGRIVKYEPQNFVMPSISLVDVPEDPGCRLEWISIPKSYFLANFKDYSRLQCHFCHPQEYPDNIEHFVTNFPESFRAEMEDSYRKIYQQIMSSKSYQSINLTRKNL